MTRILYALTVLAALAALSTALDTADDAHSAAVELAESSDGGGKEGGGDV